MTEKEKEDLFNYITNLQEENETLKELNVCVGCNNNPDYKSRIEKAIEYIKENQDMVEWIHIPVWELLNILQGDDK